MKHVELSQLLVLDRMTSQFFCRLIQNQNTRIVNLCDSDNLGKIVSNADVEIEISKEYFGGELVDEKEAITLLTGANMLNLVGNRIVKLALSLNLASKDSVRIIDNISFLLVYKSIQ